MCYSVINLHDSVCVCTWAVPISYITEALSCISEHVVTYDKRMLPRRFHYISNYRIDDVHLWVEDTWLVSR